ncbi:hypothetical protein SELMODRAFT_439202 [Selaginella moellendorffii]|uniref:Uncharacterized protein n=2 Tax=Selaginella moellendorffii TaxID=88036 RepID=D8R165_SELML|nr:hypothetical protein SELMODRAFT_439202 [Selaginella moellendorffii]
MAMFDNNKVMPAMLRKHGMWVANLHKVQFGFAAMFRAVRSSGKALQALHANASRGSASHAVPHASDGGFVICARGYSFFPAIGPHLPPPKEEGAPEGENKEDGTSPTTDDFYDLPKGPTHKEMIAARRHYLKRQARRGLLPPSRPIRKPSF